MERPYDYTASVVLFVTFSIAAALLGLFIAVQWDKVAHMVK